MSSKKDLDKKTYQEFATLKGIAVPSVRYQVFIGRLTQTVLERNGKQYNGILMDEKAINYTPQANKKKNRKNERTF